MRQGWFASGWRTLRSRWGLLPFALAAGWAVGWGFAVLRNAITFLYRAAVYRRAERQALRHRMADMATRIEAARRLTYHAVAKFAAGDDCVSEVSMAKLYATEMVNRIAYEAVQLHGGYGYMREFPVERFARDYRLWPIVSGSSEIMREIIARRLPL